MRTFKDAEGRLWEVAINVAAVKRCRGLLGVDLFGLIDEKLEGLGNLLGDPVALVDVLYVLVKGQADALGITDEQFGAGLGGDTITAATEAFMGELIDFFPNGKQRAALLRVWNAMQTVTDELASLAESQLAAIDLHSEALKFIGSSTKRPA